MCGINGFWGPGDRQLLEAMAIAQRHRGPDDEGFFESPEASLGFRRLSIIDVEHGHQPMTMDDGRLAIVYNGEVYNFRELRSQLEAAGHTFTTTCDTEVVLHAYAEWGTDAFRRFNGMWGLAILDRRDAPKVVLCRDHFGIKPLFYARSGQRWLFASEIKAILQDRSFGREVDDQQMYDYLAYGLFDHNDGTFFKGVRQVPAAHWAVIDEAGYRESRYWTPTLSEDAAAADPKAFGEVWRRAVERRLVADVPVGICLSGGLDSSSICTVMAQSLRDKVPDAASLGDTLKTFSATFPNDPIDESDYIRSVLDVTHADNADVQPTDEDFIRELEAWVWHMEEPMVSSAPFAMWMVMRLARKQVKVVLDGQAGDELLAGYDHYPYVYIRQLLRDRRWGDFVRECWQSRDIVWPLAKRRLWERQRSHAVNVKGLLRKDFVRGYKAPRDDRVPDDLKKRLLQDFVTYSLPPLLRYEDRASMAHSLEARLPFLDQELVEWVLRLPPSAIITGGWNRYVLRQALKGTLPRKVARRRKKIGFTTPEFRWYRRQRAALQSLLRSPSFNGRKYWDAPAIAEGFRRACAGEIEESMFFWRAINAEVWMRIFFDDCATALDESSHDAGFIARADRKVAAASADAAALLAAAQPNFGRHLFVERDRDVVARLPMRSKLIRPGDDIVAALCDCLDAVIGRGLQLRDGDLVVMSEKTLSISQGHSFPIEDVHPSAWARLLARFVTRTGTGVGLSHPTTMHLAIEEVGVPRILLAAAAAAVTRPFGVRGVFYRVAGSRVNAIDGPSKLNLPPYDTWAMKAPEDCEGEVVRISAALRERYGVRIEVAIIDVNDLAGEVFATSGGVTPEWVLAVTVDNPLGQSDEQTPFGLVRRVEAEVPAAALASA